MLAQQRIASNPTGSNAPLAATAEELVRRCWVQVEGKSGRVRLEFGSGEFEGSVVDLVYDGGAGELRVDVEVGAGGARTLEAWRRLGERLRDRGLPLASFEIRSG